MTKLYGTTIERDDFGTWEVKDQYGTVITRTITKKEAMEYVRNRAEEIGLKEESECQ